MDKQKSIEAFGGPVALANVLGIRRQSLDKWPPTVPEPRASQIREAIRAKIIALQELVK